MASGMISADSLKSKRKYAVVLTFIAAAVLTPPDPISQIGLAVPTILLYEVSIWLARRTERKRLEAEAEKDAEVSGGEESAAAE